MKLIAVFALLSAYARAAFAVGCFGTCYWGLSCDTGLYCSDRICMGNTCQSMRGDPEMTGLDGRTFFFDGVAGMSFNLITEQNHQVNALFVEGPHKIAVYGSEGEENGTFIGAMGFKLYDTKIQIEVTEEGEMTVQVNDQAINLSAANDYQHSGQGKTVNVTVHKYREGLGQAVHMTTALYNFLVHATPKQWDEAVQEDLRAHLNLAMAVEPSTYFLSDVHGVLGQITPDTAADNAFLPPELQTAFLGEGTDIDYAVSDLFADDFGFNRFNLTTSALTAGTVPRRVGAPKLPASRRRLIEQAPKLTPVWLSIASGSFDDL